MGITLAKHALNMHSNLGPSLHGTSSLEAARSSDSRAFLADALVCIAHNPTQLRPLRYGQFYRDSHAVPRLAGRDVRICTAMEVKIRRGYSKAIIRDAMAPYMPQEIAYRRNKIGFNSPIVDWMRGPLRSFFLDTLNSQGFKQCALVDPLRASKLVHHVMNESNATFSRGESLVERTPIPVVRGAPGPSAINRA